MKCMLKMLFEIPSTWKLFYMKDFHWIKYWSCNCWKGSLFKRSSPMISPFKTSYENAPSYLFLLPCPSLNLHLESHWDHCGVSFIAGLPCHLLIANTTLNLPKIPLLKHVFGSSSDGLFTPNKLHLNLAWL